MCGRLVVARPPEVLAALFDAREGPTLRRWYQPSFNLPPTRVAVGLVAAAAGRVLDAYRWGFGGRFFNARSETVATNGLFSPALAARRLAVVADGFFEWERAGPGRRRPLFFQRADGAPLTLAGLWEPGGAVATCTVITTEAEGGDVAAIHDRMPVILEGEALEAWLAPGRPADRVALLRPAPRGTLVAHPVDPRVGDIRHDDPSLIVPFDPPEEALRLFG